MTLKPRTVSAPLFSTAVIAALLAASWPGAGEARLPRGSDRSMPDLSGLTPATNPQVHGHGRIIKGLYYVAEPDGPNELVAFYNACNQTLDKRPFLIFDFGAQRYYFDADRDGRLDETGAMNSGIDPVPFALRETDWSTYCYGEAEG